MGIVENKMETVVLGLYRVKNMGYMTYSGGLCLRRALEALQGPLLGSISGDI